MSQSALQAAAFYREVAKTRTVWTVEDDIGYLAPITSSGQRAQPFWSSRQRAEKVIAEVAAYATFKPKEIPWSDFCSRWVPGLTADGLLMGVNWSGPSATGYDIPPTQVQQNVEHYVRTDDSKDER